MSCVRNCFLILHEFQVLATTYNLRALTNVCACDWSSLFGFQGLQCTTWNSQLIRPAASCPVDLHDKNIADIL